MKRHPPSPACLLLLPALLLVGGCGRQGPDTVVTGKVTYKGNPVAGTLTFAGTGKEVSAPINPDGTYVVGNPPLGPVKILVKGMPGAAAVKAGPTAGGKKLPELPGMPKGAAAAGLPPPPKYASPKGALAYEVKAGRQTHDIELLP